MTKVSFANGVVRRAGRQSAIGRRMVFAAALPAVAILAGSPFASAATLTWDPGFAGTGSDGAGSWDTTTANWSNGTADQAFTPNDGSTLAQFGVGGTADVVTLNAAIDAAGLNFNAVGSGNYTINGNGNTLTLGNSSTVGAITVNAGAPTLNAAIASGNSAAPSVTIGTPVATTTAGLTIDTGFTMGAFNVATNTTTANTLAINTGQTLSGNSTFNVGLVANTAGAPTTGTLNTALSVTGAGTLAVSNSGNFTVGVDTANYTTGASEFATLDMSGLSNFAFTSSGAAGEFDVGVSYHSGGSVLLANTSNTITAFNLRVGDSTNYGGGSVENAGSASSLTLGAGTNIFNLSDIYVGDGKDTGSVKFASGSSTGSVTIAPETTSGTAPTIYVGYGGSGSAVATGTMDFTGGHLANVTASTLWVGYRSSSGTGTTAGANGTFAFDNGTVNVGTLNISHASGASTAGVATGVLTVGGNPAYTANLNVTGTGETSLGYITAGSVAGFAVNATLNVGAGGTFTSPGIGNDNTDITAGSETLNATINITGGTLNLEGHAIADSIAGAATAYPVVLNTTAGTLENISSINGTGTAASNGVTMATAGNTLNFAGTDGWTGPTAINAGTAALNSGATLGNTAISVGTAGGTATFNAAANTSAGTSGGGTASLAVGSGSTVSMADGAIGPFTINQAVGAVGLSLTGATLDFDLSSSGADELIDTGTAFVSGTNTVDITAIGSLAPGQYPIISAVSGLTGSFVLDPSSQSEDGYTLSLSNTDTTETLTVTGVPEPTMIGLLGAGAAGLLVRRRRQPLVRI